MGRLKWYKRDPDAALAGMAELTLVERGAYNSILDLLYSREGKVPDDDVLVARMIGCHWREWRAVKGRLLQRGKIWIEDGNLTARRVQETLKEAADFAQDQRKKAAKRWQDHKKANKINKSSMPPGNAYTTTTTTTEDTPVRAASAALPNPEKELFRRGKEVLKDPKAGGFIAKLLAASDKDAVVALGIVETAAETENPREYIGAAIRGAKNGNGNYNGKRKPNGSDVFAAMANYQGNGSSKVREAFRGPEIDLTGESATQGPSDGFGGLLGLPNGK